MNGNNNEYINTIRTALDIALEYWSEDRGVRHVLDILHDNGMTPDQLLELGFAQKDVAWVIGVYDDD